MDLRIIDDLFLVEKALSMLVVNSVLLIWIRTGAFRVSVSELGRNLAVVHWCRHGGGGLGDERKEQSGSKLETSVKSREVGLYIWISISTDSSALLAVSAPATALWIDRVGAHGI